MADPAAPLVEKSAELDRAASGEPEIGRPQANRQTLKTLRQKELLVVVAGVLLVVKVTEVLLQVYNVKAATQEQL